ncbi:MAG: UvrD-helicase domain-containing protein [Gammaproteobacteria bacterium]|nr:UvrD-helicase domain-containing protein [Gammaproteobacteria bacterium]
MSVGPNRDLNSDLNSDLRARERALDPTQSFLVQAPAGSGKTELLTRRVLTLLARVSKPEEILALTFTKKAASEMRIRIINALLNNSTELSQAVIKQDKKLNWNLLSNPNRLNIMTIDALCAKIVQKMPILSQTGSESNICDEPSKYYRQAIYEIFKLINTNRPINNIEHYYIWVNNFKLLFKHFGGSYSRLQKFLLSMLYKRDQWLPYLGNLENPDGYKFIAEAFDKLNQDVIINLLNIIPLNIKCELDNILDFARSNLINLQEVKSESEYNYNQNLILNYDKNNSSYWQAVAVLLFTQDDKLSFRKTVDKRLGFPSKAQEKQDLLNIITELNNNLDDRANNFLDNFALLRKLPSFSYSKDNWDLLKTLSTALILLEAELRVLFKKNNIIDFQGLNQAALYALGNYDDVSDISLWFDYRIQHILVDEFQDTSFSQYQLLSKLTAEWNSLDNIRTLFLVGDPMQSIYRFRQADVGLFLQVKQYGLGNIPLEYLRLSKNFRSEEQIVSWVNNKFAQILPRQSNMLFGAIEYSPAEATKKLDTSLIPNLHLFGNNKNLSAENNFILNNIKKIITNSNQDKTESKVSIAILVRNRTRIIDLVRLLKAHSLKINAIDIELLSNRMVIQDLLALTKAILNLSDRVSWYSILRAPWCGLTLEDLYLLHTGNEDKSVYQILLSKNNILNHNNNKLNNLLFVLEHVFANLHKLNFYKLITQAWYALGGNIIYNSKEDLEDAKQFFNLLVILEESNYIVDVNKLTEQVASLYSRNKPDFIHDNSVYSIDIMTMHKSKGLQFDYVFLPYLDQGGRASEHEMLAWQLYHTHDYQGILLAPYYIADDIQIEFYKALRYINQQKESYELARLLYVAVTRAKKSCILTAGIDIGDLSKIREKFKSTSNNLLGKILDKLSDQEIVIYNNLGNNIGNNLENNSNNSDKTLDGISVNKLKYLDCSKYNIQNIKNNNFINYKKLQAQTRDLLVVESENNNPSQYLLIDDTSRIIGIFVHKLLYNIVNKYLNINKILDNNSGNIKSDLLNSWHNILLFQGIGLKNINKAIDIVSLAIKNILSDQTGRWLLADYEVSFAEKEFYYLFNKTKEIKKAIIDRLFIDNNIIWIIDYKLGLISEKESEFNENYQAQLKHYEFLVKNYYADLISKQYYQIKSALYIPIKKK